MREIVRTFTALAQKNELLVIEALFRFPSRLMKDQIVSNYDGFAPPPPPFEEDEDLPKCPREDDEGGNGPPGDGLGWTEEEDRLLIENFEQFRSMPKSWHLLASILPGG